MRTTAKNRQTLSDIAVKEYGDIMAVVQVAAENNMPVTAELVAGEQVECPEAEYNRKIKEYLKFKSAEPATAPAPEDEVAPRLHTEQFTKEFI